MSDEPPIYKVDPNETFCEFLKDLLHDVESREIEIASFNTAINNEIDLLTKKTVWKDVTIEMSFRRKCHYD